MQQAWLPDFSVWFSLVQSGSVWISLDQPGSAWISLDQGEMKEQRKLQHQLLMRLIL
jgi:hypothetical protein